MAEMNGDNKKKWYKSPIVIGGLIIGSILIIYLIIGGITDRRMQSDNVESDNDQSAVSNVSNFTENEEEYGDTSYSLDSVSQYSYEAESVPETEEGKEGETANEESKGKGWYFLDDKVIVFFPTHIYGDKISNNFTGDMYFEYDSTGREISSMISDTTYDSNDLSQDYYFETDEYNNITYMEDINYSYGNNIEYNDDGTVYEISSSSRENYFFYENGRICEMDTVDNNFEEKPRSITAFGYDEDGRLTEYEYTSGLTDTTIKRTYSYSGDNLSNIYVVLTSNGVEQYCNIDLYYDEYGNVIQISMDSDDPSVKTGSIYLEYEAFEVSKEEFPYYFFDTFIPQRNLDIASIVYNNYIMLHVDPILEIDQSIAIYRDHACGFTYSGYRFKNVAYYDLNLTMSDVFDFYSGYTMARKYR